MSTQHERVKEFANLFGTTVVISYYEPLLDADEWVFTRWVDWIDVPLED